MSAVEVDLVVQAGADLLGGWIGSLLALLVVYAVIASIREWLTAWN